MIMITNIKEVEKMISRINYISELLECQSRLISNVCSHDEQIEMLTFKRVQCGDINKDISELLIQVDRSEKASIRELVASVHQINAELERANRIKICFEITRLIWPQGYNICFDLLKMKYTWSFIHARHKISRANISIYKERELRLVLLLYCMYEDGEFVYDKFMSRFNNAKKKDPEMDLLTIIKQPDLVLKSEEIEKGQFEEGR